MESCGVNAPRGRNAPGAFRLLCGRSGRFARREFYLLFDLSAKRIGHPAYCRFRLGKDGESAGWSLRPGLRHSHRRGLRAGTVGLVVLLLLAFNNTAFDPSKFDLQSSITRYNASSSRHTLAAVSYVACFIPLILAHTVYVWRTMTRKKLGVEDVRNKNAY